MRARLLWIVQNADGVLSILLAGAVGVLGLADQVSPGTLQNAIALTLAVVAFGMLRDRWREEGQTDALERLADLDGLLTDTHKALEETSGVAIVSGNAITRALEQARSNTDRWYFKGSTGTYVRAVTLPSCVDAARRGQRNLDVRMEILDPTDFDLCEKYADLYRSLADDPASEQQEWTADGTRREVYATILAACWHQQRYRLLDVRIGLSSSITTFRWDLSSTSLIITQRGPRFPAMVVRRGRSHYDCWHTELNQSLEQARSVPVEQARHLPLSVQPTPDEIRAVFRALELPLPAEYTDDDLSAIAVKATSDPDPYLQVA